jgi:hypothetical protein
MRSRRLSSGQVRGRFQVGRIRPFSLQLLAFSLSVKRLASSSQFAFISPQQI